MFQHAGRRESIPLKRLGTSKESLSGSSSPPANTKANERPRACISMHSCSGAGIKLQVTSNDISQAAIENGTRLTILFFRPLNTQINKRVELFGWIGIQGRRKKPGRKQSALIVF